MIVLGLTGSAAMGKSTVVEMFKQEDVPVFDSDAEIHKLFGIADVTIALEELFPGVLVDGQFDAKRLREKVFGNHEALNILEKYLHPLLRELMKEFISNTKAPVILLDVPLLYEVGFDVFCDQVCVVNAPKEVQLNRLKERGWSDEDIKFILARQMPNEKKCEKADFVIPTNCKESETIQTVKNILSSLQ